MYPTNERPDRKKSRARVRPPAVTAGTEPVADEQPFATATPESVMPGTVSAHPTAGTYTEPVDYPAGATYGEPAAGYPTGGTFAEPSTPYVGTGGYAESPTPYAGAYGEPTLAHPPTAAYVDPLSAHATIGNADAAGVHASPGSAYPRGVDAERTLELREEQLVARKELRDVGEITVRTTIEEVPGRLEVEAQREEVEIEHVPMGQIVSERIGPYEEDGVLVVPVYEEQLVVVKRLMLKEHLRVRRVASTEHQLFEDTLRRDRLVVEDPNNTGLVHELYPTDDEQPDRDGHQEAAERDEGGPLGQLMRKVLG